MTEHSPKLHLNLTPAQHRKGQKVAMLLDWNYKQQFSHQPCEETIMRKMVPHLLFLRTDAFNTVWRMFNATHAFFCSVFVTRSQTFSRALGVVRLDWRSSKASTSQSTKKCEELRSACVCRAVRGVRVKREFSASWCQSERCKADFAYRRHTMRNKSWAFFTENCLIIDWRLLNVGECLVLCSILEIKMLQKLFCKLLNGVL